MASSPLFPPVPGSKDEKRTEAAHRAALVKAQKAQAARQEEFKGRAVRTHQAAPANMPPQGMYLQVQQAPMSFLDSMKVRYNPLNMIMHRIACMYSTKPIPVMHGRSATYEGSQVRCRHGRLMQYIWHPVLQQMCWRPISPYLQPVKYAYSRNRL